MSKNSLKSMAVTISGGQVHPTDHYASSEVNSIDPTDMMLHHTK